MKDNQQQAKKRAAIAALELISPGDVVGVGTGSTVNYFIDALSDIKGKIEGAVASSKETLTRLQKLGIPTLDLNSAGTIPIYVDGADEINDARQMIKGGGGALTGEKIVASCAEKFICIADEKKHVSMLGQFPVAVEVIPMARSFVARELVTLKADPEYRHGFISDYGNLILDVHNLDLTDPGAMESLISAIPGVVTCGIFSHQRADVALIATADGVTTL
jgi:ribose 5-phosphate isomerase A